MAGRKSLDRFVAPSEYLPVKADTGELADVYRPSIYRAVFSSPEIEHFLYLGSDISRHKYLVGKFGFRAAVAERFSVAALAKYGHPNHQLWVAANQSRFRCVMSFDLDRASALTGRISFRVPVSGSLTELNEYVTFQLSSLLPFIREITTLSQFLEILSSDSEPWPWFATNPILRAAQVVAVGRHLSVPEQKIREMLLPVSALICRNLLSPDFDSFLLGLTIDLNENGSGLH